ncbi:hypothetical protein BJF90_07390 [Pseudonocardia sp. CNS-004]|nr:hypothetical protein BJF90_07390 [Pseudonocardia sp. CNS-004]
MIMCHYDSERATYTPARPQHFLYFPPDPHQHGSLRPGGHVTLFSGAASSAYRVRIAESITEPPASAANFSSSAMPGATSLIAGTPLSASSRRTSGSARPR